MASLKYPDAATGGDGAALTLLLANHILCSSPAMGIAEAVRGGLIRVEAAMTGPVLAGPRSRAQSRARSPSARSPSASASSTAPLSPGSLRAASSSSSSSSSSGASASPVLLAPSPSLSASASAAAAGAGAGSTAFATYMHAAAAQMAALAAQAASAAEAVNAAASGSSSSAVTFSSGGAAPLPASEAAPHLASPASSLARSASPSAVYQVLAKTAKEFQVAAAAAVVASQQQQQQQQQQRAGSPSRAAMENAHRALSASQRSAAGGGGSSSSSVAGSSGGGSSSSSSAPPLRLTSPNPFRAVHLPSGEFVISSQSLGATGSGASRPHVASRSPGGGRYEALGTARFTPALAGEANAPGSVYERLANPESFTGVYRRAWESDGRINQYSETSSSMKPSAFVGNTNTGTDETIADIATTLRPNLSHQPALGVHRVNGRPAFR